MRAIRLAALAAVILVFTPAAVRAQGGDASSSLVLRGLGGVVFSSPAGAVVGGSAGARITRGRHVVVFGEAGHITNALTDSLLETLNDVIDLGEVQLPDGFDFDVKLPTTYAIGGVRFEVPTSGRATPFVEGGAGVAHIGATFSVSIGGVDFTDELNDLLDASGAIASSNEVMVMAGGGVSIPIGRRTAFDAGVRWMHVGTDSPTVNVLGVYGAISWGGR
jgi:hypothetical protein